MKKSVSILLCSAVALSTFAVSGCSKKGIQFSNQDMASVFSQALSKEVNRISHDDLQKIETFSMVTYSQSNYISVTFSGYETASEEDKTKYEATVDITGMNLSDASDLRLLTGLKRYSAVYTGYGSFDFLSDCQAIEAVYVEGNFECRDYSFLTELPALTELSLIECQVDSTDFLTELTGLRRLTLDNFTVGENYLYDLSFVSGLAELESFSAKTNWIEDLSPLSGLKKLKTLSLAYGSVEDVTPLSDMTSLTYIDLTQNCVRDVSSLTGFDPDTFERIILDLNSGITDWSPLDYLGDKVQGRPTAKNLEEASGNDNTASDAKDSSSDGEMGNADGSSVTVLPPQEEESFSDEDFGDNDIDVGMFDF